MRWPPSRESDGLWSVGLLVQSAPQGRLPHMKNSTRIVSAALCIVALMLARPTFAEEEKQFFNGKDLTGWTGTEPWWSVKDGAIVGHADNVPHNEFIWFNVEVKDFYC